MQKKNFCTNLQQPFLQNLNLILDKVFRDFKFLLKLFGLLILTSLTHVVVAEIFE